MDGTQTGWQHFAEADWAGARDAFADALEQDPGDPEALDGLGQSLWWLGERDAAIDRRREAYAAYQRRGDTRSAGRLATYLAGEDRIDGKHAEAAGWLSRARRLLAGQRKVPELGWLAIEDAKRTEDPADAEQYARAALEVAHELADPDVECMALAQLGRAVVRQGRVEEGVALLDEAMTVALGGESSDPMACGDACCTTLVVCDGLADLPRAAQWCEAVVEFTERRHFTPVQSWCRSIYGAVLVRAGDWERAKRATPSSSSRAAPLASPRAAVARPASTAASAARSSRPSCSAIRRRRSAAAAAPSESPAARAGWVSHVELAWDLPDLALGFERLASFSRLILFDKRGTGMSDPVPASEPPTLEQRMDDVRAVMDAVGSERAVIFGVSEGGNMSMLFAAAYPQRTTALCTFGCTARRLRTDDYPWAPTWEERQEAFADVESLWTSGLEWDDLAPSLDAAGRAELSRYYRRCASPGAALALLKMNSFVDVRPILPSIRVPTVVMHRAEDRDAHIEEGRYIAAHIPGARLVEFPGVDHSWWTEDRDAILDEIEEVVTVVRPAAEPNRVLATVLFTDLVRSTEGLSDLGDRDWAKLLRQHHAAVRHEFERFRGREIDTAGDGFFATFDGPARAIRCALAIGETARELGLELRAGLRTGECELFGNKVAGIAVHTGARVASLAEPGEVLVSSTVRDLVSGSGIAFEERGERDLKGIGKRQLFAVGG